MSFDKTTSGVFSNTPRSTVDSQVQQAINNRVIIRIWLPNVDGSTTTINSAVFAAAKDNESVCVGHVSVETPTKYASLWPKNGITGLFTVNEPTYHRLEDDIASENNKDPDLTICLYTLSSARITSAFKVVKCTSQGYVFIGDSSLAPENGDNCSSLAYKLLKAGGFDELANPGSLSGSVAITPNNLEEWAKTAKEREWKNFAWTQKIPQLEKEYIPQSNGVTCNIF